MAFFGWLKRKSLIHAHVMPPAKPLTPRTSFELSFAQLRRHGLLDDAHKPAIPSRPPRFDDEELGVSFFKTLVSGDCANLTLPRTFFGRSEIKDASFHNTDLRESVLCWCDFKNVDFSHACLQAADLRASVFERVRFTSCDLRDADLCGATFFDCDFAFADVTGVRLAKSQRSDVQLTKAQAAVVSWQHAEGDEPPGG